MLIKVDSERSQLLQRLDKLAERTNKNPNEILEQMITQAEEDEAWIKYHTERYEREVYYGNSIRPNKTC